MSSVDKLFYYSFSFDHFYSFQSIYFQFAFVLLIRAVTDYGIGTSSWYVQRSSIQKWETDKDKALFPALTAQNQTHKTLRTFVIDWEGGKIGGEG